MEFFSAQPDEQLEQYLQDAQLVDTATACTIAGCSRTTLQRRGPVPVAMRGAAFLYSALELIAWSVERRKRRSAIRPLPAAASSPLTTTTPIGS